VAAASVVYLRARIPERHPSASILGEERSGAGVVVAPGQVLTASYLVLGAATVETIGLDGRKREATRVAIDHESGLALLGIEGPDLDAARLGGRVRPGDPVFLLTCTGEKERSGATGHVSFVGPFEAFWEYMLDQAIMTTIVNPGLAGGPLLDARGRVVGVISLGLAAVARYSLAIPVSLFLDRRDRLQAGERMPPEERRAWIGFYAQSNDDGIAVSGVVPGGPADTAGLQRGDLVLSIDGWPVRTLRELYERMWLRQPGERLAMQVLREESIHVVEVLAGDREEFFA
jgi:S1-C subfamily serine protease